MAEQIIHTNPASLTTSPSQNINFDVTYQTSDDSKNADLLVLNLFYDDKQLKPTVDQVVYNTAATSTIFGKEVVVAEKADTSNEDADPNTNQNLSFTWFALNNDWPGDSVTYPLDLFNIPFQTTDIFSGTR
ncbi:hypothetical protein, partial [Planktothrix sp.]|uniref:hypothetical protein n=1 Tax=Planktothrix sp. TaxID=3088171 RepID=UPI0038D35722